jgi:5-methylcytosine-specific restriction protein A
MKNTVSFTKFVDTLGCHLRIGYFWSAASADQRRVVFTIWDDQLENDEYVLIPEGSPPWMSLPGAHELRKHVPLGLIDGVEVLGIRCHAEDPNATRRVRAYYDEKDLLVLKVEQRTNKTVAIVVGEINAETIKRGKLPDRITARKSAINDLDDIPEGATSPEKLIFSGSIFKRDRMVRDYVLNRAKGKCEFCGEDGFLMSSGRRYLEAHHVIGLSRNGPDTVSNVIALCPRHHREAHFGADAVELNVQMLAKAKALSEDANKA